MINIVRMDMYRLVRAKSFWIGLAVITALVVFSIFSIWFMGTPEFTDMIEAANSTGAVKMEYEDVSDMEEGQQVALSMLDTFNGMEVLQFLGGLLILNGGALLLPTLLIVALFVAGEFETGFSKNVFTSRKSRSTYFFGKSLTVLIIVLAFFLVAIAASLISAAVAGFNLVASPLPDTLLWMGLVILLVLALSMFVSLVVWFFRSKVAAVVVGIMVAAGFVGAILNGILSLLPSISFLGDYTLMASLNALGTGMFGVESADVVRIACVGLAFLVVYSAGSLVALKKKDI